MRLTEEAKLIRCAADGDAAAFDQLVLKYRKTVLNTAKAALGDWDKAEDAAQQTFIQAYKNLDGLRDTSKFKAWLMVITRRCVARYWNQPGPMTSEFSENMLYNTPEPQLNLSDISERIRASLNELSTRNRRVMILHYLDGYSSQEIGNRLGIPSGTVRRILHESRNSLKVNLHAVNTGSERGITGMNALKYTTNGPRHLVWWINGRWPGSRTNSLMAQSICLIINKCAKTIDEIAKEADANIEFVQEELNPLVDEELVEKTAGGRYLTNFIALNARDWIEITRGIRQYGVKLADAIIPYLPKLEDAWNHTSLPGRGFSWSEGIWPMLSLFVLNIGLTRNAFPDRPAPVHSNSGCRYWAGGREVVEEKYMLWCTGLSFSGQTEGGLLAHGHFWSYGLERLRTGWNNESLKVLAAIAAGIMDIEIIAEKTCLSIEQTRDIIASVIEFGIVEKKGNNLRLTFPVIHKEDSDILTPVVNDVIMQMANEIILPATADAAEKLGELGYSHLEEQFHQWRRWLAGDIAGESLRELLKRGVLPKPGNPAPLKFCMVGWLEPIQLLSW